MSRPARITILCEDRQQSCFVRRFPMNRGWTRHDIREEISPQGRGSGEQSVRERFPVELRAYRIQANHQRTGLIVVIDADKQGSLIAPAALTAHVTKRASDGGNTANWSCTLSPSGTSKPGLRICAESRLTKKRIRSV